MGLDAFVHCRCAVDGRSAPPPAPFELTNDGLVCDEGLGLDSLLAFDRWLTEGCDHEGMQHRVVHVSNWAGYRHFQAALLRVGASRFPTLIGELPAANGGWTSPASAASCLRELEVFERSEVMWDVVQLVDSDTGDVLAERVDAHDGVFILNGTEGWTGRLTASGTYLVEASEGAASHPAALFEASEFIQSSTGDGRWAWTDPHGKSFLSPHGLSSRRDDGGEYWPSGLSVVERQVGSSSCSFVTASLKEIFEASAAVDMPIHWT